MSSRRRFTEPRRQWKQAFTKVIEQYQEMRGAQTCTSVEGFYNGLAREGGRTPFNPRVVVPSKSDFICDVEVAARRVLRDAEYEYFLDAYVNNLREPNSAEMNRALEEKLGKAFIQRGIHPTSEYFSAKDLR